MPFLFLLYMVAYLDRVNISFAKLQMDTDLNLSDQVYSLGAGIFFLGYFVFEIPSNLILHRVGARRWIARILLTWGLISSACAWIHSPASFYTLRFLLGLSEAGFFPGIIYYLTLWFPSERRSKATAFFLLAIPMSGIFGGPISGWIMTALDGFFDFRGWQWLFIVEGIPAVLLGFVTLFCLADGPEQVSWLSPLEKDYLKQRLNHHPAGYTEYLASALGSVRVWGLTSIYFILAMSLYGVTFWLPQIVQDIDQSSLQMTGFLTAIPYAAAALFMVLAGISSDKKHERRLHLTAGTALAASGFVASMLFYSSPVLSLVAISLTASGILASLALFWPIPSAMLTGRAAAGGIALINSIGNLGGYAGPVIVGWLKESTHRMDSGLLFLAGSLFLASFLTWMLVQKLDQTA